MQPDTSVQDAPPSAGVDDRLSDLTTLVDGLATDGAGPASLTSPLAFENHLVEVRLGVASSLFMALRCRHAPTAAHSMRVALNCSAWAMWQGVPTEQRDHLEVAALLHDIGKIGVPDAVLLKAGSLLPDEHELFDAQRRAGLGILCSCCATPAILDIIRLSPDWYDGSRAGQQVAGPDIPLGARMLAIVDAFDSMISDQVYRRALSRERAVAELFRTAGQQFDPGLVARFGEFQSSEPLDAQVARHWLHGLDPAMSNSFWKFNPSPSLARVPTDLFQGKLVDNMHDGVAFFDRHKRVVMWNRGLERLTGIGQGSVYDTTWEPGLIGMGDERGRPIDPDDCPVEYSLRTSTQSMRRMTLMGRNGRTVPVNLHTLPVTGADGTVQGAALLLHDASSETTLEQRCQNLHERATQDQLTKVANRAEFDRTLNLFVAAHLQRQLPCSLIICDIDHFKRVNDQFGHPAGDDVLQNFAKVLKSFCRPGDLVARYGGEEFVILCADCDSATASQRADEVRRAVAALRHPAIGNRAITASFGVTEVQAGDTSAAMVARADRALMEAKQRGRNQVVQLGTGIHETHEKRSWFWWLSRRAAGDILIDTWLATTVPLNIALEKLRGFVDDHSAEVLNPDGDKLVIRVNGHGMPQSRRSSDRPVPFLVALTFLEEKVETSTVGGVSTGFTLHTKIHVEIRPRRSRDRRQGGALQRAKGILASLKSYLVATEQGAPQVRSVARRVTNVLASWAARQQGNA